MAGEGGAGGGDGGGSADWQPIYDRVEAMVSKSQAQAEALAADRARLEAADRVQRESWEVARRLQRSVDELQAAALEQDAEMDRLRAEAADARKKLQADATKKTRWEAAYVELLLGANQKLAELRDGDLEDSRTCAETPNSKEVGRGANLNQDAVDHTASDLSAELRKLKQAYQTLISKKDKEVCALLSEKNSVRNQLDIMQQDYAELLKNNKVAEAQASEASEAALKLQKSVDELKASAQKKDGEIARLQAEAVEAKKKHGKDLFALLSKKNSVHNKLSIMQQDYTEILKKKKILTHKKDHEIVILRAEAFGAKKKVQKMHALVKEKDDEIQRLKSRHPESVQKYKDISETHKRSRSGNPAVIVRDKLENSGIGQTVEEDYISETRTAETNGQDECTHKRRRSSPMSNDDEKSGSNEDDDEQIGSEEDGDKPTGSEEDGDKPTGSDEDGDKQSGSDEDGDKRSESDEDGDKQSGSDEDGDKQSGSDEDGDKQSGSDEDGDGDDNEYMRDIMTRYQSRGYCRAPAPLRQKKLEITDGQRSMVRTGHWGKYVKAVNDSLLDQPDKHKEFVRFLRNFKSWRVPYVARTMKVILDGQPKLTRQFNRFLPNNCQIYVKEEEEEEKQLPEVEEPRQRGVPQPRGQLPSASPSASASAAAGLIKLKDAEHQSKWERV